jgi:hypothetical protein
LQPAGAHGDDRRRVERVETIPPLESREEEADFCFDLGPAWGELNGSPVDMDMHLEARLVLFELLQFNPDVIELFERWADGTDLGREVIGYRHFLERVGTTLGFESWADYVRAADEDPGGERLITIEEAETEEEARRIWQQRIRDLEAECDPRIETFEQAIRDFDAEGFMQDVTGLVRGKWVLPWPWVAIGLAHEWFLSMYSIAFARPILVTDWIEPADRNPTVPHFETREGERLTDAMRRLIEETLGAQEPPARKRRASSEVVARYVECWYRNRIMKQSVRSIAGADDKRKLVRHAIRRADEWLGCSNWIWDDQPSETPENDSSAPLGS